MIISAELVKALREKTGAGVMDCKLALTETQCDLEAATEWLRAKGILRATRKADRVAAEGLVAVIVEGGKGGMIELNSETDFVARNETFRSAAMAFAKGALATNGDHEALLDAPIPETGERVRDRVTALSATIGENIVLRRCAVVSAREGVVVPYVHGAIATGLGAIGVLVALKSEAQTDLLLPFGRKIAMHIAAAAPLWITTDDIPSAVLEERRAALAEDAARSGKSAAVVEKMIEGRMRKFQQETVLLQQAFVLDTDSTAGTALAEAERTVGAPIAITAFARFRTGEGLNKSSAGDAS